MKYLAAGIIAFLVLVGGILFGHSIVPSSPSFGSTAFTPVSGKTYYLAGAGVTSSANTITLSSFTLPDPNNTPIINSMFSGTQYGVLEAQTSKTEDITFTGVTQNGNGTATLTGVSRGISFYSPFVASTTLQLAHAGGATFILSNPAAFYAQFLTGTNNNNIYGTFTFSSTSPPVYDADPIWANFSTQALADVSYVNSVVAAGCANGSQTVKGCVQLATQIQSASSTAFGSTAAALVGNNLYSTSSPGTAGLWNVWTQNDGKIATTFLNGVEQYIWNGLATFNSGFIDNASSTFTSTANFNGTNVFNGASILASTTITGPVAISGTIHGVPTVISASSSIMSLAAQTGTTTVYTVKIPANTLTNASQIKIEADYGNTNTQGGNVFCSGIVQLGTGSATTTIGYVTNPVSVLGYAQLMSTISMPTSNTENSLSYGFGSGALYNQNTSFVFSGGTTTAYALNAPLYIGFAISSAGAGSGTICNLYGESVTLLQ
jgi:hypothetical protein